MLCETLPRLEADEYPGGLWYYEPHTYQPYRYVLGWAAARWCASASTPAPPSPVRWTPL